MRNGGAVCWRARLQKLAALSTCEAELYALCETMKQGIWLKEILGKLDLDLDLLDCQTNPSKSVKTMLLP